MSNVASANAVASVAALIGDPTRANILSELMGGRALTAGELARAAGVTAQTASGHLARMTDSALLTAEKHGRHRYYRLASGEIAHAFEALSLVAVSGPRRYHPVGPKDEAMRLARTCYDHMAGRLALALADSLCGRNHVSLADGGGIVTDEGMAFLSGLGVDLTGAGRTRRPLCRTCLDWSERRPHISGRLGSALLRRLIELRWVAPGATGRALRVTVEGHRELRATFALPADWQDPPRTA